MIAVDQLYDSPTAIAIAVIVTLPSLLSALAIFLVRKSHKAIDTPGEMTLGETVASTNRAMLDHGVQLSELRHHLNKHEGTLQDVQKTLHDHVNTEEPLLLESRARMADLQETVDTHIEEDHKFFEKIFGILGEKPASTAAKKTTKKAPAVKKTPAKRPVKKAP